MKNIASRIARIQGEHQNGERARRSHVYSPERTMMNTNSSPSPKLDALLRDAAAGDAQAVRGLLERHHARLFRRMIASRLDRRLASRLDPSDLVQETLADAARRLPDYLRDRPVPFYAWLFRQAIDRLARAVPGSLGPHGPGHRQGRTLEPAAPRRRDKGTGVSPSRRWLQIPEPWRRAYSRGFVGELCREKRPRITATYRILTQD